MGTLDRLRRRVQLDRRKGWLAGVCAGIAHAVGTDPAFVRVGLVVTALFWPKLVIGAYLIAWVLLDDGERRTAGKPNRRKIDDIY